MGTYLTLREQLIELMTPKVVYKHAENPASLVVKGEFYPIGLHPFFGILRRNGGYYNLMNI